MNEWNAVLHWLYYYCYWYVLKFMFRSITYSACGVFWLLHFFAHACNENVCVLWVCVSNCLQKWIELVDKRFSTMHNSFNSHFMLEAQIFTWFEMNVRDRECIRVDLHTFWIYWRLFMSWSSAQISLVYVTYCH